MEKIQILNINKPGSVSNVQKDKYDDMMAAILNALPTVTPGLNQNEMSKKILQYLSPTLFPNGEKSMWWMKAVQLDLEARKVISRQKTKPLTWIKN